MSRRIFYEVSEAQLQLLGKLLDGDDVQFWPVNVLENIEVSVVGHDVFCIGCYGAINNTDCDWAEPATGSWCQERRVS